MILAKYTGARLAATADATLSIVNTIVLKVTGRGRQFTR